MERESLGQVPGVKDAELLAGLNDLRGIPTPVNVADRLGIAVRAIVEDRAQIGWRKVISLRLIPGPEDEWSVNRWGKFPASRTRNCWRLSMTSEAYRRRSTSRTGLESRFGQ